MKTIILSNFGPLSQYLQIAVSEVKGCTEQGVQYYIGKMYSQEVAFLSGKGQQEETLDKVLESLAKDHELIVTIDFAQGCHEYSRPGDVIVEGTTEMCNRLTDQFLAKYDELMDETNLRAFKGEIKALDQCDLGETVACCDSQEYQYSIMEQLPILNIRIIQQENETDYSRYTPVFHKLVSVLKQVIGGR